MLCGTERSDNPAHTPAQPKSNTGMGVDIALRTHRAASEVEGHVVRDNKAGVSEGAVRDLHPVAVRERNRQARHLELVNGEGAVRLLLRVG